MSRGGKSAVATTMETRSNTISFHRLKENADLHGFFDGSFARHFDLCYVIAWQAIEESEVVLCSSC